MARTGLPKKYAKFGFAKGWKLYKAAKRKYGTVKKRVSKVARKVTRKRKPKTGVTTMAVKRRRRVAAKTPVRRRRRTTVMSNRVIKTLVDAGLIGGTALGATFIVSKVPVVATWRPGMKALFLAIAGVFGVTFAKNLFLKKAFSGSIVAAAITLLLPYMPEGFTFAGRARSFSRSELNQLRTMGLPVASNGVKTGLPIQSMGIPVTSVGRGKRGYAGAY